MNISHHKFESHSFTMENVNTENKLVKTNSIKLKNGKPKRKYVWKNKPDYAEIFRKRKLLKLLRESKE